MKKNLLVILFVLMAGSTIYAQIDQALDYFKVKDCLTQVISKAQSDGMTDPKLIYAGAFKRTVTTNIPNLGNVTVKINFKLENGTSNVWLYLLSSQEGSEQRLSPYIAVKVKIFGYQVVAIPLDTLMNGNLPIDVLSPLTDNNWINSDKMAEIFRNSAEVSNFTGKHEPETMSVGVLNNSSIPLFGAGISIWALTMESGGDFLVCCIENSTQTHLCSDKPLAVEEQPQAGELSFYPNPVVDVLNVSFGREIPTGRVTLYNLLGNVVIMKEFSNAENIGINTAGIPQGIYSLTIDDGKTINRNTVSILR